MKHAQQGLTLLEVLIVLAIIAILLPVAVPSFAAMTKQARFADLTGDLIGNLNYARSEAIRRNQTVYACALNAKTNLQIQGCGQAKAPNGFAWNEGILLFADAPEGHTTRYDRDERLRHALFDGTIRVSSNTPILAFNSEGHLPDPDAGTFVLRDQASGECRTIQVSHGGRARSCRSGEAGCDVC